MKKVLIIGIILIVIAIVVGTVIIININNNKNDKDNINTENKIILNTKQFVNTLEKIDIVGTNDYVKINKKVKWEVPDLGEGVTVSFSIAIPYTITVNGIDYDGEYMLNSYSENTMDKNPKYDFRVTNLTKDGNIEILVTLK